jgi:NIMA (never in mitosis gene a)-related kinase 1/4/5
MALGLHYMHKRNFIHRDIKSLNIFLTKDNSARVGDLGASRRLCPDTGIVMDEINPDEKVGTPFYLAPELWLDKPCSKATDVWAIGCILYEMCALQVPFLAEDIDVLE